MKLLGNSHAQALGPRLQQHFPDLAVVANPGWTLKRTLDAGLVDGAADELVLLEFSTNEVFNRWTFDEYAAELLAAKVALDGCRVVLVGPPALDNGQLGAAAEEWDGLACAEAERLGWD